MGSLTALNRGFSAEHRPSRTALKTSTNLAVQQVWKPEAFPEARITGWVLFTAVSFRAKSTISHLTSSVSVYNVIILCGSETERALTTALGEHSRL